MSQSNALTLAVIGDVHDQWEVEDGEALLALGVDLALFVGDFGNESVEIVRLISELALPKAVILGNHDAWYTASAWGRKKSPYNHQVEDRVQQQLDLLGATHVGYGKLDFPQFKLSVVGGRPFSWGGKDWKNKTFLRHRYGVNNFAESTLKIVAEAEKTSFDTVIFLGHNGPLGLGAEPEDICGQDWQPLGGDHGDPDLTDAIAKVKQRGKTVPLVTFGHMHHRLRHTQTRQRTKVKQIEETVYLNSASVPRLQSQAGATIRNFTLVTLNNQQVSQASLVWVNAQFQIIAQEDLLS